MKFIVDQQVEDIELPENLKLNTFLQEFHSDCPHSECSFGFYGFAFGQSPFPVPKIMQDALIKNADTGAYAAVQGFEISDEINEYFKITREIHEIMGEFVYDELSKIEGVKVTKPEATFYLLADFNHYASELQAMKINTSQKLSEALIVHPYHTAIVGGDSLVLERTDYSARIAYVDYDGTKVYENYQKQKPKTHDEKREFEKTNAPRIVAGIEMIAKFFVKLKKDVENLSSKRDSLSVPN